MFLHSVPGELPRSRSQALIICRSRSIVHMDEDGRGSHPDMSGLRDELREASPGLFMGPALLRLLGKPRLILFFACDTRPAQVS